MKSSINVAKSLGVNPDFLFLSNKYKAVLSVCTCICYPISTCSYLKNIYKHECAVDLFKSYSLGAYHL